MIELEIVKNSHPILREMMTRHYSKPLGFVGRNIVYAVWCLGKLYGFTVAGSAMKLYASREYFKWLPLNTIVNNTFFHVEPLDGKYPIRNFVQKVIAIWREDVLDEWPMKYGDQVDGFETLVEIPRTGECYIRDGWKCVGRTIGYTCKRTGGVGTDTWSGKRVWDTFNLRPKLIFVRESDR